MGLRPPSGHGHGGECARPWPSTSMRSRPKARLYVVGHSLGGGVALKLALMYPERVGALVLVGSVGVGEALSGFDRLLAVPMVGKRDSSHRGGRPAPRPDHRDALLGTTPGRPGGEEGGDPAHLAGGDRERRASDRRTLEAELPRRAASPLGRDPATRSRRSVGSPFPTAVVSGRLGPHRARLGREDPRRANPGCRAPRRDRGPPAPLRKAGQDRRDRPPLLGARRRSSGTNSCSEKRLKLELGLGQLRGRVRVGDDADAGKEPRRAPRDDGGPDPEVPLAVAAGVHAADRAGVTVPVELLELGEIVERQVDRRSCDRGVGCKSADELEGARVARPRVSDKVPVSRCRDGSRCAALGSRGRRVPRGDRPPETGRRRSCRRRPGARSAPWPRRAGPPRPARSAPRSPLRAAVPARGSEAIWAPWRRMRSSGVAPMKPSMAKAVQEG